MVVGTKKVELSAILRRLVRDTEGNECAGQKEVGMICREYLTLILTLYNLQKIHFYDFPWNSDISPILQMKNEARRSEMSSRGSAARMLACGAHTLPQQASGSFYHIPLPISGFLEFCLKGIQMNGN